MHTVDIMCTCTYTQCMCVYIGIHTYTHTYMYRCTWQPTPVLLSGESHGLRSLEGYSPQGQKESDMTKVI